MYNILIIEDESAAKDNLISMLTDIMGDEISSINVCESIKQSVEYISNNASSDVIFMDIHLADGNAFKIFEMVEINSPIIFTTAYDEFALKAFSVNSIDYILKPLNQKELVRAVSKLKSLSQLDKQNYINKVSTMVQQETGEQKTFLLQLRDKIIRLNISDIAFCYTSDEQVTAYTKQGNTYILNFPLATLMTKLSTSDFFRANRQYIISKDAIAEVEVWHGSRLRVMTCTKEPKDIIISKLRVSEFKKWLAQ